MYKAFIFDLDGTLADTIESIAYSANKALENLGLKEVEVEKYKKFAGDGVVELLGRVLKAAGDEQLQYFSQMETEYRRIFEKYCMYKVAPYEGMIETLEGLKKSHIKIAVLSNKPHERTIDVVESLFGKGYFDYVQGQSEEIEKKPSPKGALNIAERFGVKTEECVYVGDTDTDMITGNRAGMFTVGVTWGFRDRQELEENQSHLIVNHPKELLELI